MVAAGGDDRMKPKAADRDIERRQRAEHIDTVRRQGNFFICFTQRRLLERFAGLDDSTRQ